MKIVAFLIFSSLWLIHVRVSNADYRFRRMPPPPRAPQFPQFAKKYHNPYVRQSRPPRPIPMQMNPQFKKPIGPPMVVIPQRSIPVRPPPPNPVKLTVAWAAPNFPNNRPVVKQPEPKPFVSSPTIQTEYDFHVQTNQIPSHIPQTQTLPHSNIIQLTDDKGPIHTIPAPNLSLADKPAHLEIIPPKQQTPATTTTVEIIKSQQYQVTEPPEQKKIYRQQNYIPEVVTPKEQPEIMLTSNEQVNQLSQQDLYKILQNYPPLNTFGLMQQPPQLEQQPLGLETLQYYQTDPTFLVQQQQQEQQHLEQPQQLNHEPQHHYQEQQPNLQLEQQLPKYQIEQQQNPYHELQQNFHHELQQTLRHEQQQNLRHEQQQNPHHEQQQQNRHYEEQSDHHREEQPDNYRQDQPDNYRQEQQFHQHQQKEIKPEYHTFNYVEPAIKTSKTEYKIEHPQASESQTFLRNYYEQQPEQTINGNTIPDFQNYELPELKDDYAGSFYSSLPSKEAAQSLASLQEAGKQNSQQVAVETASSKKPMTIYVPDDGEPDNDKYKRQNDAEGAGTGVYDYEEIGGQDDDVDDVQSETFGSRIRPKI